METTTLLSIIGIFFGFNLITSSALFFTNSSSYSRYIRVFILIRFFIFLGISIWMIILNEWLGHVAHANKIKTLYASSYSIDSVASIALNVMLSTKSPSKRDEWKYRSEFTKNYDGVKPKRFFDYVTEFFGVIFLFASIATSAIAAWLSNGDIHSMVFSSVFTLSSIVMSSWFFISIQKMSKENIRYNGLVEIMRSFDKVSSREQKREVGKKLARLHVDIFGSSWFYKKVFETTQAIVIDIAIQCELTWDDIERYFPKNGKFNLMKWNTFKNDFPEVAKKLEKNKE